jgi:hypothetical protein
MEKFCIATASGEKLPALSLLAMNMRFGAALLRNTMPLAVAGRRRAARGVNPPL